MKKKQEQNQPKNGSIDSNPINPINKNESISNQKKVSEIKAKNSKIVNKRKPKPKNRQVIWQKNNACRKFRQKRYFGQYFLSLFPCFMRLFFHKTRQVYKKITDF